MDARPGNSVEAREHAARTQERIDRLLDELRHDLEEVDGDAARGVYSSAAQTLEALSRQFHRLAEGERGWRREP